MADLNFKINVSGNANEAVGSLKKQLREAQAEVGVLSDKFGATSKQAIEAAKRASELKDRIGDAKALTDAFNPDAKFKALTSSLSGVAGGFAAVQGSIGLFGGEAKNVEKALLKVQSAMALSQGLQSIGESVDSFKQLKAVVIDVGSKAFGSLRAAIISTGIGALVIGLGLLIANFDKVKKAVLNFIPGLAQVGEFFGKLVDTVTDFIGVTSEAERQLEKLQKTTLRGNEAIQDRIKILQAQGGKEKEIYAESQKAVENELNVLRQSLKVKGELNEEESKRFRELKNEQEVLRITETRRIEEENKKQADERRKASEEQQRIANERREKELRAEEEYQKQQKESADRRRRDLKDLQEDIDKDNEKKKEQEIKDNDAFLDRLSKRGEASLKQAQLIKNEGEITVATEEQKRDAYQATGEAFGALSDLVGRQTAAGKALAVGQALINTFLGVTEVLRNKTTIPEPFGTIQKVSSIATILASGFSAVRQIKATQIPGGGGGGGSIPSISSASPITPQLAQPLTTNISAQSINALGNQAIKAYVVETDVTSNQQRIKAIQQRARFD
jgi:hypothetical protein